MIKSLGDKVVIKTIEISSTTKTGIILPESTKEKPQEGQVVQVGPGRLLENGERLTPEVNIGDHVIFSRYAGTEIRYQNENLLIMNERDILAIIG